MTEQQNVRPPTCRRTPTRVVLTILLALMAVLVFAQLISAQGDDLAPAAQDDVPTSEELQAMPPSIERYISAHTLSSDAVLPANLDSSTITASADVAAPSETVEFTIQVANNGQLDIPVEVTTKLPVDLAYVSHQCNAAATMACGFDTDTVTWRGTVPEGGNASVVLSARVALDAEPNSILKVVAHVVSAEQDFDRSAEVTVSAIKLSKVQLLPLTLFGIQPEPGPVTLAAGSPNSANTWTVSWTEAALSTGYELQESQLADFSSVTPHVVGPQTSLSITKQPEPFNIYYYRVRSLIGNRAGPWSNVVSVVGGYRDDFDNAGTNWGLRRMTNAGVVKGFYENGRYVMQITSRWDWAIVSPGLPAPRVPYVIDFEAKLMSQAYAHSGGVVFGGDWLQPACPPDASDDGLHRHKVCFNHFYNINNIFEDTIPSRPTLRLLFERVDKLEWRPNEGGSPLKRRGDIREGSTPVYKAVDPRDWNHYRVEVRADSIKIYAARVGEDLRFHYEYEDTRWIGDPYFGFFASTDLIENATWRFEYMQVMPLDN